MRTLLVRAFAVACYAAFLASFAYFAAFLFDLTPSSAPTDSALAVFVDVALVLLFGATHSAMARQPWKRWLARWWPREAERSLYVLVASAQLALLCAVWRPLPLGTLWSVTGTGALALRAVQGAGLFLVLASSFAIDHFELFGLRQAFARSPSPTPFSTPLLYRFVRHPLYLGILVALWAAPRMSVGRLALAGGLTLYVLVGMRLEERDLLRMYGQSYARYRAKVGALIPRLFRPRDE